MGLIITQTSHDNTVLGIADNQVRLAVICSTMKRQGDPDVWKREEELMMLQVILDALKNYDVDFDYLSTDDLNYLYELAEILSEN